MKKKIAIQTLRLTNNYGGILQAFALQKYLELKGHKVIHLNRQKKIKGILLRLKIFIYNLIKYKSIKYSKKTDENFRRFIDANINLSIPLYSKEEWDSFIFENNFEVLIAGSDQIWRLEYNNGYTAECFLKYIKSEVKKIAYSASFGSLDDCDYSENELKSLLVDFDRISVREKDAVNFVKKHYTRNVVHIIDPTLLFSGDEYIQMFDLKRINRAKTIFAYILDNEDVKDQIIKSCQEHLGYELDFVFGGSVLKSKNREPHIMQKPTIEQWIQKFIISDFVVTDSFHGMLFSVIFNKEFIVIGNEKRGITRFTSFLEIFNLEHRLLMSLSELKSELLSETINWDTVNSNKRNLQKKADCFLINSLNI